MSPEQFGELLGELRAIKFILLAAATLVTLSVTLAAYRTYTYIKHYVVKGLNDLFRTEGLDLLESGRLDDLISECQRKLLDRPNHAYAHWYLGRAYFLQERWQDARTEFETLRRISPDWASSIDPYIEEIGEKGGSY
jgi:cytochrome c-type biogenesis protein CcmH/NrfG